MGQVMRSKEEVLDDRQSEIDHFVIRILRPVVHLFHLFILFISPDSHECDHEVAC